MLGDGRVQRVMLTFLLWVERKSRCGALGGEQMHGGDWSGV